MSAAASVKNHAMFSKIGALKAAEQLAYDLKSRELCVCEKCTKVPTTRKKPFLRILTNLTKRSESNKDIIEDAILIVKNKSKLNNIKS